MFRDYGHHVIQRIIDMTRSHVWVSKWEVAAVSLRRQFLFYGTSGQYVTSSDIV